MYTVFHMFYPHLSLLVFVEEIDKALEVLGFVRARHRRAHVVMNTQLTVWGIKKTLIKKS